MGVGGKVGIIVGVGGKVGGIVGGRAGGACGGAVDKNALSPAGVRDPVLPLSGERGTTTVDAPSVAEEVTDSTARGGSEGSTQGRDGLPTEDSGGARDYLGIKF